MASGVHRKRGGVFVKKREKRERENEKKQGREIIFSIRRPAKGLPKWLRRQPWRRRLRSSNLPRCHPDCWLPVRSRARAETTAFGVGGGRKESAMATTPKLKGKGGEKLTLSKHAQKKHRPRRPVPRPPLRHGLRRSRGRPRPRLRCFALAQGPFSPRLFGRGGPRRRRARRWRRAPRPRAAEDGKAGGHAVALRLRGLVAVRGRAAGGVPLGARRLCRRRKRKGAGGRRRRERH